LGQLVCLDVERMTAAELLGFVERPEWGSSQRYTALCACHAFIRWRFGSRHPALAARVKRLAGKPQPRLTFDQVRLLLQSFGGSDAGLRDRALACVALDTALRASELCALDVGNVYLDDGKLYALVKGGSWSWRTFSEPTAEALRNWLAVRAPALGVSAVFVSFQHQSRGKGLTREGLQIIMRRWGRAVGFHISPHMFRRSYATISTLNGAPKNIVKAGGGWKSDEMVDHYIGELEVESTRQYAPVGRLF